MIGFEMFVNHKCLILFVFGMSYMRLEKEI